MQPHYLLLTKPITDQQVKTRWAWLSPQLSLQPFSADKAASAAHLYHSRATVKLSAKHEDQETLGSDKDNPIFQKIKPNNPMSDSFDLLFSMKTFLNSITQ